MILIIIAYKDQKSRKIKNEILLLMLGLAIIRIMSENATNMITNLVGMLVISIPMLFITVIRPGAFGGGDIKLVAAGGLYLGESRMICATLIAVLAAGLYCIGLLIIKKLSRKTTFPFGPFLSLGMILVIIFM